MIKVRIFFYLIFFFFVEITDNIPNDCMILFSQNFLCGTLDRVFQAGFSNNQASVKYFIEWIVILSLHKYPQFLDKFWDCFCYVSKTFGIHLKSNLNKEGTVCCPIPYFMCSSLPLKAVGC